VADNWLRIKEREGQSTHAFPSALMIPFILSSSRGVSISVLAALAVIAISFEQSASAQAAPTFSKVVVFGDSLSDVGNVRDKMEEKFFLSYPGGDYNYSDGRFTNSSDTDPSSSDYAGVWHEQLARKFLMLPAAAASLNGGNNFAFGGATTQDGSSDRTVFDNPAPFGGGNNSVTVDNIGRQIDRYLNQQTIDPTALYIVWGGGNDFFDDDSAASVTATSHRVVALINRLITAGAKQILVANVPPLGDIPFYGDDGEKQDSLNKASAHFRDELNADIDANASPYAGNNGATIYRLDIWSLFVRFVANPGAYGFTDITHRAQGQSSANPDAYLFWDDIHPTTAAHFLIAKEANRVLNGGIIPTAPASNLSTRANVQMGENVTIGGFIITGTEPKRVVLRGIGPSLIEKGVTGALANPTIELFDQTKASIASNDDWQETQQAEIFATGLAPTNQLEAAIVQTLAPGNYTVLLNGKDGGTGVGLVEIYDAASGTNSTLANASTRGAVGVDGDVMIGGVIIGDGSDAITVLRVLGPSLTNGGVTNPLLDPMLELYDANGAQIETNDDWRSGRPSAVKATLLAPSDDRESVIVASLASGNYTALVRGKNGSTGVALIEMFRIP
jgi:phospholipase/lecithinase/hemolysin